MQANRASLLPAAERRLRAGHEPHQLSENIDSAPASALLNDKLQQLRKLPTPLAPAEDGIATAKVSPLPGFSSLRCSNFGKLQAIRRLLRDGCEDHQVKPFVFTIGAKQELVSENSGLEGFIHAQERFEKRVGVQASHALFPHYVAYIERVLEGEALGRALLADVQGISQSSDALAVKHDRLLGIVREKTEEWRAAVLKLDGALWARHLRAYQLFPRTFNIPGFRDLYGVAVENGANSGKFFADLTEHDLKALRDHSFSVLRPMGVFPIGAVNAKGTAGGSPYSIIAHDVDPSHGSRKDVADALDRAFGTGMLTVFEVVPNHTSCDARLLQTNPSLYVHTRSQPDDMEGYYHYMHPEFGEFWIRHGGYTNLGTGERNFWVDTLQLDFSKPETREFVIAELCDLIRQYSLDGIRVDSAYQLLHEYLRQNWRGELAQELPKREFLDELVWRVKTEFPHVAILAEAFTGFDKLAECGFDLLYGISSMERNGGYMHVGWHEALCSRNAQKIRSAIERADFLSWQVGGPDIVTFFGHQDFPSPQRQFGEDWKWGAAVLSILRPGAFSFYAGTEACFEAPCREDNKVITFNEPVSINWRAGSTDFAEFQRQLLKLAGHMRATLGERTRLEALEPLGYDAHAPWVGYMISSSLSGVDAKFAIIANTTASPVKARFAHPETGSTMTISLSAMGPEGFEIVQLT